MSSTLRSYPSVSHVLLLAPTAAAAAFDVMILDPAVAVDLIPAGPLFRDQPHGYAPLRKLPATLRLPGRGARALEVILELLPWSDHRSELAISTTVRPHLLVERSVAAYLDAAHRYLSTLAEHMDPRRNHHLPGAGPADREPPRSKGRPDGWELGTGTTGLPPTSTQHPRSKEAAVAEQVKLRGGAVVLIRPVEAADAPLLAGAFERLGNASRQSRFLTAKPHLSAQELHALADVDHYDHEALGALDTRDGRVLGVARYIRHAADPTSAEVAITVVDEWQGRGLGGELMASLTRRAREDGIDRFTALVAPGNLAVARLLRGSGADVNVTTRDRYSIEYEIALAG